MKTTKNYFIEGKLIREGSEISIEEGRSDFDIEELVSQLEDLTDRNMHEEALMLIAEKLELDHFVNLFKYISLIHDIEGYLPREISAYRDNLSLKMFEIIESIYGQEVKDLVHGAL